MSSIKLELPQRNEMAAICHYILKHISPNVSLSNLQIFEIYDVISSQNPNASRDNIARLLMNQYTNKYVSH